MPCRGSILIACPALLLAACGKSVILAPPTQRLVAQSVYRHSGYRPYDVRCPSGVPAQVGRQFQCHFTGPDGKYVAYLLITSVHGRRVTYNIQLHRIGQTLLVAPSERSISDFVFKHTGVRPTNVTCPSGIPAVAGTTYQCHYSAPDGHYVAYVQITSVQGANVNSRIQTRRTG